MSFQMIDQLIHLFVYIFSVLENVLLLATHGVYHKMKSSIYIYNHVFHTEASSLPSYEE